MASAPRVVAGAPGHGESVVWGNPGACGLLCCLTANLAFSVSFRLQNACSPLLSEIHNSYIWWDLAVEGFLGCSLHGHGAWKLQTK